MMKRRRTRTYYEGGVDDAPAKENGDDDKGEEPTEPPEKFMQYFSWARHEDLFKIIA
jgi:hypothetical protein